MTWEVEVTWGVGAGVGFVRAGGGAGLGTDSVRVGAG